ncbi:MAG: cyclic nucleotide-binding domain-containing protein [Betaproteobacteria bacterium]|nr:cyclic nucleotide-binding domain-containing protein [Betaproteobacteria bacterium]
MASTARNRGSEKALRNIELFAGIADSSLDRISHECTWRTCHPGQQVISRESRDRHVYFIVSGKVRVSAYSAAGREVAFRDVGAGKCFGEISAIDGLPRSANVEALEESVVASVSPQLFWKLLETEPSVMANVVRLLTATIRSLSDRLFELSTLGIQNRVHAEILRLAKEAGLQGRAAIIDPVPRHVDIASRISTNREQVTKELSAMARQGLVEKRGRALIVPDVGRLERIVAEVRRST